MRTGCRNTAKTVVVGSSAQFVEVDRKLHGLQRSNLVILAARPGMGKTSLALGMARNVATQTGRPVVFFSMEMGALELTKRLLAMEAGQMDGTAGGFLMRRHWPSTDVKD